MFVRQEARAKSARRSKAKPRPRVPRPHLPGGLQQRHLDLIGLMLIAFGVYLAFVLFFGWDGGKVGYGRRRRRLGIWSGRLGPGSSPS